MYITDTNYFSSSVNNRYLKTTLIALLLSLIINLIIIYNLQNWEIKLVNSNKFQNRVMSLILLPKEDEDSIEKYVEANPDVPSKEPEETNNFSNKDQVAAQPKPVKEKSEDGSPLIEGELEDSPKIVSKEFSEVEVLTEASWQAQSEISQENNESDVIDVEDPNLIPPPLQSIPEFIDDQIINDNGIDTYLDPYDKSTDQIVKTKNKDKNLTTNPLSDSFLSQMKKMRKPEIQQSKNKNLNTPQPRPQLKNKILSGPLKKTYSGVPGTGQFAINSKLSDYGEYLSRLYEVIGTQWTKLATHVALSSSEVSSQVIIEFILTSSGQVKKLDVIHTTAGQAGTLICKDAVKSRAPFGNWTSDMLNALGDEQLLRVTFIYY